ncbi:uncharacterized protein ARB_05488 [Trichophyton benhamiae CBS 112371]|uniref:Uncharacterized protein n=1 Tax=Arthroderma benhamiae (strain ATCC MYA-4681 / CBS 112371) TaxID=663331 RepID=D4AMN5_ARTBC|nr:uncharacterized protein ARB_05488 [Trichophyton benhamiae CBS 112371]EFE35446.1 hypothetical protein ARB_05488 [Trichophyton benhamiae CBS 112371]
MIARNEDGYSEHPPSANNLIHAQGSHLTYSRRRPSFRHSLDPVSCRHAVWIDFISVLRSKKETKKTIERDTVNFAPTAASLFKPNHQITGLRPAWLQWKLKDGTMAPNSFYELDAVWGWWRRIILCTSRIALKMKSSFCQKGVGSSAPRWRNRYITTPRRHAENQKEKKKKGAKEKKGEEDPDGAIFSFTSYWECIIS